MLSYRYCMVGVPFYQCFGYHKVFEVLIREIDIFYGIHNYFPSINVVGIIIEEVVLVV